VAAARIAFRLDMCYLTKITNRMIGRFLLIKDFGAQVNIKYGCSIRAGGPKEKVRWPTHVPEKAELLEKLKEGGFDVPDFIYVPASISGTNDFGARSVSGKAPRRVSR
jgi:hypothetical protein